MDKEELLFEMLKDKPTEGTSKFIKKFTRLGFDTKMLRDLYLRIINYQVEKYEYTLTKSEEYTGKRR